MVVDPAASLELPRRSDRLRWEWRLGRGRWSPEAPGDSEGWRYSPPLAVRLRSRKMTVGELAHGDPPAASPSLTRSEALPVMMHRQMRKTSGLDASKMIVEVVQMLYKFCNLFHELKNVIPTFQNRRSGVTQRILTLLEPGAEVPRWPLREYWLNITRAGNSRQAQESIKSDLVR